MADPSDKNKDRISGRVSMVQTIERPAKKIGRFGFKATHATLREQGAAALFNDMGISNRVLRGKDKRLEISEPDLKAMLFYMQASGVPKARNQNDSNVKAGKEIFKRIGCDDCHVMTLKTASRTKIPELANQTFHPFTDLLLHNMGSGLSDKRAEFSALGSEWRTTPLWGIGLTDDLTEKEPAFLHDGRARTIEEAILWHDGEAKHSKQNFRGLPKAERDQLIAFLRSI